MKDKYILYALCHTEYAKNKMKERWKKVGIFDTEPEATSCIPLGREHRFRIYKLGEVITT